MKKLLLYVILLLPINSFSQSSRPLSDMCHSKSNTLENIQNMMVDGGWETPVIHNKNYLERTIEHQTSKQLIQIIDSIYSWGWDLVNYTGWNFEPSDKSLNIVYDANNNCISLISKHMFGSTWKNNYKTTYTYDANNNRTSFTFQNWNDSIWVNNEQKFYTYDANNNLTSVLSNTNWNGSTWTNSSKGTLTYDSNNNWINEIVQYWDGSTWVYYSQNTLTYDVNNNLTTKLIQLWNDSIWENSSKYSYTYDANNNKISELTQYGNYNAWNNSDSSEYTYDTNNNRIYELNQKWVNSTWVNSYQYTYTYAVNNNLTSYIGQKWLNNNWLNDIYNTYIYDTNNNQTSLFIQTWAVDSWVHEYLYNNTYDVNNFIKSDSYKYWSSGGPLANNGDSTYYYFHTIVGIDDLMMQRESISVYPNPAKDKLTIKSMQKSTLEILNIQGQTIQQKPIQQGKTDIYISGLAKGLYILRLNSNDKTEVTRFVKE